jgi:hypothetical protein
MPTLPSLGKLLSTAVLLLTATIQAQLTEPPTVRVGVLSLFHPQILILTTAQPITLLVDGRPVTLAARAPAVIQASAGAIAIDVFPTRIRSVHTLAVPAPSALTLTVPQKLTRTYTGALTLTARSNELLPVITMATETAVASIVAAESPANAPLESLKAQAIASRSFLLATPAPHAEMDACDTTHCQFLREPPPPTSLAARATRATQGVVLTWRPDPSAAPAIVRAMYSRSCGPRTVVPANLPAGSYPFYSVSCDFCRQHPDHARIYSTGHGIGLCQLAAADMAAHGDTARAILAHFYPNTALTTLTASR